MGENPSGIGVRGRMGRRRGGRPFVPQQGRRDDRDTYFEKAWFKPIPIQENGRQELWGLHHGMTAWRHGEEAMGPFHDEVGFLLWDKAHGEVMSTVVFGRGIAILGGSSAKPHDKVLTFDARPGEPHYGVVQNKYLLERAESAISRARSRSTTTAP
jgi:hypothetical protein